MMVAFHMCAGRRAARLFSLGEKDRALVQKSDFRQRGRAVTVGYDPFVTWYCVADTSENTNSRPRAHPYR